MHEKRAQIEHTAHPDAVLQGFNSETNSGWAWDVTHLVDCLSSKLRTLSSVPEQHKPGLVAIAVIPALSLGSIVRERTACTT